MQSHSLKAKTERRSDVCVCRFPAVSFSVFLPLCLILCCLPNAISAQTADPDDPETERASFQVADGFEASLFASEKEGVVKPIQMRFDARGRLWVIGSTVYPLIEPGQVPNDKVLILEDTDGDGRSDKTTVFADGLMIPTGLELGNGGAYVGHGTELLFLRDTDGDGRADERRVLLHGFGTGDNHQNINSFLWGPGGELWMSQGLHTHSNVETPWGIVRLNQAGLWRFRPKLLRLEGFYGSEFEPQNPWGYVFTDWGEPIVIAGNNSSAIYPVPGLIVNHRDEAPTLIWKEGHGRKSSNGDIVGTTHFPESWQGLLIQGGYINNAVWALKIIDDGAGFMLEDRPPLIKSTSRNFRPVDAKFAPDGSLYICDWYNPIIGHYQASFRDPGRDKTHGRIWRVTAKGRPLTKPPELVGKSALELLDELKSPDRWTRHFTKRVLADLPAEQVIGALKSWTSQPGLSEHALKEALGVYQSHEVPAPELLERLCKAKDPGARAYAASVVGAWAERLSDPLALLEPLASDENARVRLHAIVACTYIPSSRSMEVAAAAADLPTDKFIDYAFRQAVFALKPYWLPALQQVKLDLGNNASRLGAVIRADATPDTLQAVRSLAQSGAMDARNRETYLRLLAEIGTGEDLGVILHLREPTIQARLLPVVGATARVRNIRPKGDLAAVLQPLVHDENKNLQGEALKLAGIWKVEALRAQAESSATDAKADEALRRASIEALSSFGDEASGRLLSVLTSGSPASIQSAALVGLTSVDLATAAQRAGQVLNQFTDEQLLRDIFTAFLRRQGGAAALTKVLQDRTPSRLVAEAGLRIMSAGGRRDEKLAQLLTAATGNGVSEKRMSPDEMIRFVTEVRDQGDSAHGSDIFHRVELGCISCHSVNGQGGAIGPDLSALGTAQPIDFIVGAILDPQKEVKEGFVSVSVTTKDGNEYQGYIRRETPEEIVLRDALQNSEVRLRRDVIQTRRQNGSVMPSGLVDTLSRADFRDLVRYLSDLGKQRP